MSHGSASDREGRRKADRNREAGSAAAEGGEEGVRTSASASPELEALSKSSRQGGGRQAGVPKRLGGSGGATGKRSDVVSMSSTEAQNGFGHLLETVARDATVFITRRNAPRAVVMSVERYRELTRGAEPDLDELTAEFDALLERMQSSRAREGLRAAFRATPDELAEAAVAAAREGGR